MQATKTLLPTTATYVEDKAKHSFMRIMDTKSSCGYSLSNFHVEKCYRQVCVYVHVFVRRLP